MEKKILKMNTINIELSELQEQIFAEHKAIEGSENFTFVADSNGTTVYAVEDGTREIIVITPKKKPSPTPKNLIGSPESEENSEIGYTYMAMIEAYTQDLSKVVCQMQSHTLAHILKLGYTVEYLKDYDLYHTDRKYYKITW